MHLLMTALAAGLALVPLPLAIYQPIGEMQAQMAIVILFGLATSTALTHAGITGTLSQADPQGKTS